MALFSRRWNSRGLQNTSLEMTRFTNLMTQKLEETHHDVLFLFKYKKSRRNVGRHWKESSNSGRLAIIIINEKTFLINNFCKALYTWLAYYVEWISWRASVRWVYCSNINYDIHTNSQIKYKTFTIYQSSNVCIQH